MTYISDGSTASYYVLPEGARELQDLISERDMNAQIGEIFRACYRYGECRHSDKLRDAKKILFYAQAEVRRLEKLQADTRRGKPTWVSAPEWAKVRPDWKDAPEWAQWLTQNADGGWLWWEEMPIAGKSQWVDGLHEGTISFGGVSPVIGDWRETLEHRPVEEVE